MALKLDLSVKYESELNTTYCEFDLDVISPNSQHAAIWKQA